jgi:hypothetical protein
MLVVVGAVGGPAAVAGCGGGGGGGGSLSQTREAAAVFVRNCSACHSLIGNESRHRQGGDLVGYRLSRREPGAPGRCPELKADPRAHTRERTSVP